MATGTTAKRSYESGHVITRKCGGAVPLGALVKLHSTEGQVVVTTAITDVVRGVSLGTYASGDMGEFQTAGTCKVLTGEAIALGAQIMPIGTGGGKAATLAGATAVGCGQAQTLVDADGQLVEVDLIRCVKSAVGS